ncbi:protein VACUOLELESS GAMETOPHYTES-like [Lycium ferocissimum]|uniref:protein VACUOLELESS GAMETOPHYTES-like n=1 Tax=Lycium ferocissimum TaxID=112874 RepID=UPI002815131A|nr:protein VACUOLELESS GAMETOPHYTES-like [Lycium ferocissimum]
MKKVNCASYLRDDDDDNISPAGFPRMILNLPKPSASSSHNRRRFVVDSSESEDEGHAHQWYKHSNALAQLQPVNDISQLLRMMLNLKPGAGTGRPQLTLNPNRRPVVDSSDTDDEGLTHHYMQIKHFSHPHALNKYDIQQYSETNCKVCGLQLVGSAYGCQSCQFYLHASCFDLPRKIQHGAHLAHPLTLRYPSYYKHCGKVCNACREQIRSFMYCCDLCSFDLHVTCATLYSIAKRADTSKDSLTLYYSFPVSDSNNTMPWVARCNVCNKKVSKEGWLYYSKDTGYIAHIKCAKGAEGGPPRIKERLNLLKLK